MKIWLEPTRLKNWNGSNALKDTNGNGTPKAS